MMRSLVIAASLLLLGGCDGGASVPTKAPAPAAPAMTVGNTYHDGMLELAPLQQGAALRRAIRSAGESCDRVEAAGFQADHKNLKLWTARCQKKTYAVFLAANGDVQVRDCADAAVLKLPACVPPQIKTAI